MVIVKEIVMLKAVVSLKKMEEKTLKKGLKNKVIKLKRKDVEIN